MNFFQQKNLQHLIGNETRVIIFFGASGKVGRILLSEIPQNVFVINVSRQLGLLHPRVANIKSDLSYADPEKLLKKILRITGRIDIVVFASVKVSQQALEFQTENCMEEEYRINVHFPVLFTQACMKYFNKEGEIENRKRQRRIITLSSMITRNGHVHTLRFDLGPYAAQKAALEFSMKYLAHPLAKAGVASAILAPTQMKGEEYLKKVCAVFWNTALEKEIGGATVEYIVDGE